MLPSTNTASPPPPPNEQTTTEQPTSRRRKPTSPEATDDPPPPPQPPLKCPRCDSTNTKFCYYNNYSLSQPRHFCKTCRRYWTRGGALRNVPIGGGYRRTKRPRPAGETLIAFNPLPDFRLPTLFPFAGDLNLNPASGALRFARGIGSPAVLSFSSPYNFSGGDRMSSIAGGNGGGSLASSIENLSSLNRWKLQNQRSAMVYGGAEGIEMNLNKGTDYQNEGGAGAVTTTHIAEKPQPIFFQNILEVPDATNPHRQSAIAGGNEGESAPAAAGEWFFGGSYGGGKENDGLNGDRYQHINGLA